MKPLSLTARLVLFFAAAATAVLIASGLVLSRTVDLHFVEHDLAEIEGKIGQVGRLLNTVHTRDDLHSLPSLLDEVLAGRIGISVAVVDRDGLVFHAGEADDFPREAMASPGVPLTWSGAGHHFRSLARVLPTGLPGGETVTVAVALNITHHEEFMVFFGRLVATFIVFAALIMTAFGWAAARRGLAPLRTVAAVAAKVSAARLGERLPAEDVPSELRELAQVFNAMLARLEDSFRRLSRFSADIAHELRTPLNNLLMQSQVALTRTRTPEEYRDFLSSSVEEYERLARMVADMLFLAKADNGLIIPHRESIDLTATATRIIEFFVPLAAEKEVHVALTGRATTTGDRLMIDRAISNLLSNAIRHATPGSSVAVRLADEPSGLSVTVENRGETIPAQDLPHLFDRFYRADPARHDAAESAGLGLAITRSIVEAHGGRIGVQSDGGLTRFTLVLPPEPPAGSA